MRKSFSKSWRMLKDDSGAALMMAIFTVTLLMVIATEIMYESNVELVVSSQAINQVKAHYAAKAGVEISLLRIHIHRKASQMIGSQIPASMLDPIWQFPFSWPPVLPDEISIADKSQIQSTVKESTMQGQYLATIESEGSKLDINELASPSETVRESTREQLLQIFQSEIENNETFGERYRGYDFEGLINNMMDWVDADSEGVGGGDERSIYGNPSNEFIPPNQPFKTLQELNMVEGMNDDIFKFLADRVTIYGAKGINVNYADKKVLMSLSPQITFERADLILEARGDASRGPFKDEDDFVRYLESIGVTGNPFRGENNEPTVHLIFDAERYFRIRSTGQSGKVSREITAIVYDFDRAKARVKEQLIAQTKAQGPGGENPTPTPTPDPAGNSPPEGDTPEKSEPEKTDGGAVPKQRPEIIYWNET